MSNKKSPVLTYVLIFVLVVVAVLTGVNNYFRPFDEIVLGEPKDIPQVTPQSMSTTESADMVDIEKEIETLVATFSPEEKIAQIIAVPIDTEEFMASISAFSSEVDENGSIDSSEYVGFLTGKISPSNASDNQTVPLFLEDWGFATIFGSNVSAQQAESMISFLKRTALISVPRWILVDHEGGSVQRLSGPGFTDLPSWQEQCKLKSEDRVKLLTQSATELSNVGVDAVLAPMLDIAKRHPVLKTRICSDDSTVIFESASEFVSVFNALKVLPVLKHFPGIGSAKKDLHTAFDTVTVTEADIDLYSSILDVFPFTGVMISHVGVENQGATAPCSLSSDCVGQMYQKYPEVLTFTDALEMKSTGVDDAEVYLEDVALEAVKAGNTVLVFGDGVSQSDLKIVHERLLREFHSSYEFRERVNKNIALILRYKLAK